MKKYTKEEFLKAAELGEVSIIDAKHTCSLLEEAKLILKGEEVYEFVEDDRLKQERCFDCCFRNEQCKHGVFINFPCTSKEREDGKTGIWKNKTKI